MDQTNYEVGQYARLKRSSSNADRGNMNPSISCVCVAPDPFATNVGKRGAPMYSTDNPECWHGPGTTILRIFQYGGLLLENQSGGVQVAQPDQVCRL